MNFGLTTDSYLRDKETVYVSADVDLSYSTTSGGRLFCTDRRCVYLSGHRALDLDLDSIEVIDYRPWSPWNSLVIFGALMSLAGFIFYFAGSMIQELPSDARLLFSGLAVAYGLFAIGYSFYTRKDSLEVVTSGSSYKFVGKDLEDIPHAIRGAA